MLLKHAVSILKMQYNVNIWGVQKLFSTTIAWSHHKGRATVQEICKEHRHTLGSKEPVTEKTRRKNVFVVRTKGFSRQNVKFRAGSRSIKGEQTKGPFLKLKKQTDRRIDGRMDRWRHWQRHRLCNCWVTFLHWKKIKQYFFFFSHPAFSWSSLKAAVRSIKLRRSDEWQMLRGWRNRWLRLEGDGYCLPSGPVQVFPPPLDKHFLLAL